MLTIGFGLLVAAVGLLFLAGSVESLQSHWFIAVIKVIMFSAFLYELFRDAKDLYGKAPGHHYYLDLRSFYDILAVNAGAVAAFFTSIELGHGGVIASAITGLTAAVLVPGYAASRLLRLLCGDGLHRRLLILSESVFRLISGLSYLCRRQTGLQRLRRQARDHRFFGNPDLPASS